MLEAVATNCVSNDIDINCISRLSQLGIKQIL